MSSIRILNRISKEDAGQLLFFIGLAAFAIVARLIDHAPNFAPVAAMGLLAGYVCRSAKVGIIGVVLAMLVSDAVIGFDSVMMRLVVYGSLIVAVGLGTALKNQTGLMLGAGLVGSSLLSSVVFYAITNLAVWAFSGMYEHTMQGLVLCYTYALPFLRHTVAGDLFYTGALFAVYMLPALYKSRSVAIGD